MAKLVILRSPIAFTSSASPSLIYSYLDGFRQFSLVGKFMMVFSSPSRFFSLVMRSFPGTNSPDLHASAYMAKFSGNSSLNCNAIPFPITPTVLTAFTSASAFAVRRLPFVNRIMDKSIFCECLLNCRNVSVLEYDGLCIPLWDSELFRSCAKITFFGSNIHVY